MPEYSYVARFSAKGHHIKRLRGDAKKLTSAGTHKIKLRDALNTVAKSIGFSCWDAVVANPCPERDQFFANFYSARTVHASSKVYKKFLAERRLTDSSESFRQYTVEMLDGYKKMGFNRLVRSPTNLAGSELLVKLNDYWKSQGAKALLPQHLPANLLYSLVDEYVAFRDAYEDDADPNSISLSGSVFVVSVIKQHQTHIKGLGSSTVEFDEDELWSAIEKYFIAAYLEEMSRNTKAQARPATLKNVFSDHRKIYIKWPDN